MRLNTVLLSVCATLAGSVAASAGTFDFNTLVNQVVHLHVNAYASNENDGAYFVGNTTGYLSADPDALFNMFCVDFAGTISPPTDYDVTVRSLAAANYSGANALGLTLDQLQEMAILGSRFGTGDMNLDIALQHDIWSFTSSGKFTPDSLLSEAQTQLVSTDFSNAYLLDITSPDHQQAFETIAFGQPNPNTADALPEPATFLLLAAGLVVLGSTRRHRRMRLESPEPSRRR